MSRRVARKRGRQQRHKRQAAASPTVVEVASRWPVRRGALLAAGLVAAAVYAYWFYASRLPTIEQQLGGAEFRRAHVLLYVIQPELFPNFFLDRWFGVPRSMGMADRLPVLLWAAGVMAVAAAGGWLLLGLLRLDERLDRLETFVFSSTVGLAATSTCVLAAGLAGWLRHPLVYAAPAAVVVFAAVARFYQSRRVPAQVSAPGKYGSGSDAAEDGGPFGLGWLWLAVPFVLILLLGGMLPPVDFDVREYHLQAPKEWYQQGRITFLPHNVYANMPAGAGMFALLAMGVTGDWWLGALVGKTVVAAMAPLTALALLAAVRRFFSTSAGVVAAVAYISTPWILRVSTSGLVEGAVALYTLLSVYAAVLWKKSLHQDEEAHAREDSSRGGKPAERDPEEAEKPGEHRDAAVPRPSTRGSGQTDSGDSTAFVLLAGYLAGAAVSVKYPPALFLVVPLGAWIVVSQWKVASARRTDWQSVLRPASAFLLAVAVGCGLWLGKNWVLAGNPTYPLLYGVFGGESFTAEQNQRWNAVHRPHDFSAAALVRDLGPVALRSEWLSPLVFPLALLALGSRKRRRLVLGLAGYCVFLLAAWWLLTHRIDRFWVPMLSIVALLAGVGASLSRERPWRLAMATILLLGLGMNLLTALTVAVREQAYFVHLARLRIDPAWHDPWHLRFNARWADPAFNPRAPEGRLLAVGDAAVFDLAMPVDYATCFDECPLERLVRGRTPAEIRAELDRRRIALVYVHWPEIRRYRATYGFSDFVQPAVLDELVAQGILEPLPMLSEHSGRAYRVR